MYQGSTFLSKLRSLLVKYIVEKCLCSSRLLEVNILESIIVNKQFVVNILSLVNLTTWFFFSNSHVLEGVRLYLSRYQRREKLLSWKKFVIKLVCLISWYDLFLWKHCLNARFSLEEKWTWYFSSSSSLFGTVLVINGRL